MKGIYCINVDLDKKRVYIPDKAKRDFVELGKEESYEILDKQKIDIYAVKLDYEQELTLFIMKRDKKGMWYAHDKIDSNKKYLLGKSEEITYDKIVEADKNINRL